MTKLTILPPNISRRIQLSRNRKPIDKTLKAKIALEAVKNEKTIAQIASEYEVQPNQVSIWKKQLLENMTGLFEDKRSKKFREEDYQKREDEHHRQLGKAQCEIEWLKKKCKQLGL